MERATRLYHVLMEGGAIVGVFKTRAAAEASIVERALNDPNTSWTIDEYETVEEDKCTRD